MRLIDADALKEDIEQQCAMLRLMKDNDGLTQISVVLESGFKAQIDKMQTIEERKKAHIIKDEDGNIKCSNCGSPECWGNYCMNCGADMRT